MGRVLTFIICWGIGGGLVLGLLYILGMRDDIGVGIVLGAFIGAAIMNKWESHLMNMIPGHSHKSDTQKQSAKIIELRATMKSKDLNNWLTSDNKLIDTVCFVGGTVSLFYGLSSFVSTETITIFLPESKKFILIGAGLIAFGLLRRSWVKK